MAPRVSTTYDRVSTPSQGSFSSRPRFAGLTEKVNALEALALERDELREEQSDTIRRAMNVIERYAARLGIDVESDSVLDSIDEVLGGAGEEE